MAETFPTDSLSNAAREVLRLDVMDAYTALVPDRSGSEAAKTLLEKLNEQTVVNAPVRSQSDAMSLLAGLWLWHDYLGESHSISQKIETGTGSFWHAIMHRREGDFSNSKYWYARCSGHPILATLAARADDIIKPFPADKSLLKLTAAGWNANAFVDLVEQVHDRPDDPRHKAAIALQQLEWRTLFDHCQRSAV
ncbi:MAG TPA: hypothetical protein PKB10_00960 [Tepidisphaeraceae bacterium]|nr:hypothetical protein [Tepidisphaeraceae bacterium]